jgi:exopolysaccharide biosynthesis polyprenyl glycosylphosphotransferase
MLRERTAMLRKMAMIADAVLACVAFMLGYYIRVRMGGFMSTENLRWLLPAFAFTWVYLLYFSGHYKSFRTAEMTDVLYSVFKSAFFGLLIFTAVMFLFKHVHLSRYFISFIFVSATVLLCAEKMLYMWVFRQLRKRGYNFRNIVIVGTGRRALAFADMVAKHGEWGLRIIGFVDEDAQKGCTHVNGCKVIGSLSDMQKILHENIVDEVVFVVPRAWLDKIEDAIYFCEIEGVRVHVAVDLFELKFAKAKQSDLQGFPLLSFDSTPDKHWHLLIKRFFDVIASGLGLLVLAIPFAIVSLLIKFTSPGPVFFRQKRSGLNGRVFTLLKFRTMQVGAEEKLKELLSKNEMKGPVFKMENDPRVTPLGKWLRKLSIDELPQLWNVFIGDMSVVGPRPPIPAEVKQYDNWHRRRLSMRPGITCIWQVSGRNKINDFDRWMKLDLQYIDNWSLFLDAKLLLRTVPVVLFGIGAK